MTTQCEAYEAMKLREVPQGHTHTDTGPEETYEDVWLVSDGCSPTQTAVAGQETATQEMYEEVAIH